jgi:hypothetical protein
MTSPTNSAVDIVHEFLKPMWKPKPKGGKPGIVRELHWKVEAVLNYAIAKQYIVGANAANLDGPLGQLLPPIDSFHVAKHREALPYDQIGKFMKDLRASVYHGASGYCPICASPHRAEIEAARRADNGVVGLRSHPSATSYHSIAARFGVHAGMIWRHFHRGHEQRPPMTYMKRPKSSYAIDLIILTAVRKDQVQGAEWTEIDWDERTLTSPMWKVLGEEQGHKTGKKSQEDYVTPLCDDAMDILRTMKKWQEDNGIKSKFVFPSEGNPHGKKLSKKSTGKMAHHTVNAPAKRIGKRLGFPDITIHGFRTTFSTWATDHGYDDKDIEMQLGHVVGNPVRNKYKDKRVVLRIKERREMMEDWADYCRRIEPLPADGISSFHSEETLQP